MLFLTAFLMTFQMVIHTGSPAGDLRITAELWVNEAFVPAVSCHDVFEKSGIVVMRAHMLTHRGTHTHTHIHTHTPWKQRQKDSSVIESRWGWQLKGSSVLSVSHSPSLYFLSHPLVYPSLFVPPQYIHDSISFSLFWPILEWPDLPLVVFLCSVGQQGRGAGCYQAGQMAWSSLGLEVSDWGKPTGQTGDCGSRQELCGKQLQHHHCNCPPNAN